VQHLVQDHFTGGLVTEASDLPRRAPGAKRSTMNGVKDRVLDMTERIASLHASSLWPGRAESSGLPHSRRQAHAAPGTGPMLLALVGGPDEGQLVPAVVRCRERQQDVAPGEGLVYEHP
jgi:hypothetical protein